MPTRTIKRHDTASLPRMRALDSDGVPINLMGATGTYTLVLPDGTLKVDRGAAGIVDQATSPGEVYYLWQPADVDTAGRYREEWEIVYTDGRKETFPTKSKWYVVIEPDADDT
jgi:hypothetical protein